MRLVAEGSVISTSSACVRLGWRRPQDYLWYSRADLRVGHERERACALARRTAATGRAHDLIHTQCTRSHPGRLAT